MNQLMEIINLGIVIKLIAWPLFLVISLMIILTIIKNYELKKPTKR
ncbi:MAG: hypothetical protein PHH06_01570 [Candidatus Gracilibacteria bacterium]|nr:hypothetical protein [Candidatus Gracilibacteria bacterium]